MYCTNCEPLQPQTAVVTCVDVIDSVAVSVFYWIIAASLAELASAIPSSGGVYHWATITAGPRWGRICGFFAGWWNYFAWIFGTSALVRLSTLGANDWE